MARLLCVGDLNVDVRVTLHHPLVIGSDTDGTVAMTGGGSAANVATWAAREGTGSRFVGPIGDDHLGRFLKDELAGHGVQVAPVIRTDGITRSVLALVGADGNRSLISDQDNLLALTDSDFDGDWFERVDWLHLTTYTYIAARSRELFGRLIREAVDRSIPVSIDPSAAELLRSNCTRAAVREAFSGGEVLFPSQDEAHWLSGHADPEQAAVDLLDLTPCVVVTCGADGAYAANRSGLAEWMPAAPTDLVNTLGCGDAFAAGFIAGRLAGFDDRVSVLRGLNVAARAAAISSAR